MTEIETFAANVLDNVECVIVGKRPVLELFMVALLCEGHVLLEDVPGVGNWKATANTASILLKRTRSPGSGMPGTRCENIYASE